MSSNKRVLRAGDVKQTKDGQSGAEHKKEVDNKKKPAFGKNSCNLYSKKDGTAESAGVSEKKKDVEESNMKLGQIYKIDQFITNTKVDGLQVLHTICYDSIGKPAMVRKNLRKFNGFEFAAEPDEFNKRMKATEKVDIAKLKAICKGLDIEMKGTKEELAARIIKFLQAPEGGEDPPTEEETTSSSEEDTKEKSDLPAVAKDDKVSKSGRPKLASTDSSQASDSPSSSSFDEKGRNFPKTTKHRGKNESASGSNCNSVGGSGSDNAKKRCDAGDRISVLKKAKITPPTDGEIRRYIKEILEGANLDVITMKIVLLKVFAKYPGFDLSQKQDLIKATVKSLIA